MLRGSGIPADSSGGHKNGVCGSLQYAGRYAGSRALVMSWFLWVCVTGEVTIEGGIQFTLDSELTAEPPQFTLTCISTGGPATSPSWTRDNELITEGAETGLNDSETARYTHTLTVTGRLGGEYVCNVSNSISSTLSSELNIKGVKSEAKVF